MLEEEALPSRGILELMEQREASSFCRMMIVILEKNYLKDIIQVHENEPDAKGVQGYWATDLNVTFPFQSHENNHKGRESI